MVADAAYYLRELRGRISEEERENLENDTIHYISKFNRATLLRMLREPENRSGTVDTDRASALETALKLYLDQYMTDMPQGHKWVILSCLFLSMIAGEPLHPREMTGWVREGGAYYCRAREEQPGSVCCWCVCRSCATK